MTDARTIFDPFLGKDVVIVDRLTDRLRGNYACGPHLPNGRPEFGFRQFQAPPIQHEAAAVLDALVDALKVAREAIWNGGDTVLALSKIDAVLDAVSQPRDSHD